MTTDLTAPLPAPRHEDKAAPRVVRALKAFEEAVGGRDTLVNELVTLQLPEAESMVLRLLADPDNDGTPLHEVLGQAQVSVAKFLRIFRDARGARAYLAALDRVWSRLPDVAEDVMERALPKSVPCRTCRETGKIEVASKKRVKDKVLCPDCDGVGRRQVEPTLDYQRLALSLGGLPKPIPAVHIDQSSKTQHNLVIQDALRDFIGVVAKIKRAPIDAEATIIEGEDGDDE